MKKLIFCLALALVMSVSFACGAWADDEKGTVAVKQYLLERGEDGSLQPLTDKIFQPAVYRQNELDTAAYNYSGQYSEWSSKTLAKTNSTVNLWSDSAISGALDKLTFVENVGGGAVFFRTIFAFPDEGGFDAKVLKCRNTDDYTWDCVENVTIEETQYKLLVKTEARDNSSGWYEITNKIHPWNYTGYDKKSN